eukprot:753880-Hanusia_phi.AAC.4
MIGEDGWCVNLDKESKYSLILLQQQQHPNSSSQSSSSSCSPYSGSCRHLISSTTIITILLLLLQAGPSQICRRCRIYEDRPSFCRTSAENFEVTAGGLSSYSTLVLQRLYDVPKEDFEHVAIEACKVKSTGL